jgi:hypothetical protein
MKQASWILCREPLTMLRFVQERLSSRKLRLFACACCRRIIHQVNDSRSSLALAVNERFADGQATEAELDAARKQAEDAFVESNARRTEVAERTSAWSVWAALRQRRGPLSPAEGNRLIPSAAWVAAAVRTAGGWDWDQNPEERVAQADLLRDLIDPFAALTLDPLWLRGADGLVPRLARTIYDERAFERLTILADALEDVGCTEERLLEHCRQGRLHAPGCWAVDALLAQE